MKASRRTTVSTDTGVRPGRRHELIESGHLTPQAAKEILSMQSEMGAALQRAVEDLEGAAKSMGSRMHSSTAVQHGYLQASAGAGTRVPLSLSVRPCSTWTDSRP